MSCAQCWSLLDDGTGIYCLYVLIHDPTLDSCTIRRVCFDGLSGDRRINVVTRDSACKGKATISLTGLSNSPDDAFCLDHDVASDEGVRKKPEERLRCVWGQDLSDSERGAPPSSLRTTGTLAARHEPRPIFPSRAGSGGLGTLGRGGRAGTGRGRRDSQR